MRHRKKMEDRRKEIVNAAVVIAKDSGLQSITGQKVADAIGVTRPLIHNYFSVMADLYEEVIKFAIEEQNLKILGEALIIKHPATAGMKPGLKRKAISTIL